MNGLPQYQAGVCILFLGGCAFRACRTKKSFWWCPKGQKPGCRKPGLEALVQGKVMWCLEGRACVFFITDAQQSVWHIVSFQKKVCWNAVTWWEAICRYLQSSWFQKSGDPDSKFCHFLSIWCFETHFTFLEFQFPEVWGSFSHSFTKQLLNTSQVPYIVLSLN